MPRQRPTKEADAPRTFPQALCCSTPLAGRPSHRSHQATHSRCPHSGGQEDAAMRAPLAIASVGVALIAGGACSTQRPKPTTIAAVAIVSHHHDVPEPPTTTTTPPTPPTTVPHAVTPTWPKAPHIDAVSSGRCGGDLPPCSVMYCENGGKLTGKNPRSTASGKWQILDSTWAGYSGYAHAQDAPESVQDAKARQIYAGGAGRSQWVC